MRMSLITQLRRMALLAPIAATLTFSPLAANGCDRGDDTVGEELGDAADEAGDEIEDAMD